MMYLRNAFARARAPCASLDGRVCCYGPQEWSISPFVDDVRLDHCWTKTGSNDFELKVLLVQSRDAEMHASTRVTVGDHASWSTSSFL